MQCEDVSRSGREDYQPVDHIGQGPTAKLLSYPTKQCIPPSERQQVYTRASPSPLGGLGSTSFGIKLYDMDGKQFRDQGSTVMGRDRASQNASRDKPWSSQSLPHHYQ